MSSQFDEKLIQKIHDVFDNYEDSQADHGWLELRKKYPQNRRRPAAYYWAGSAAAVLLLAFGIWALPDKSVEETAAVKKNISITAPQDKIVKKEKEQQFSNIPDNTHTTEYEAYTKSKPASKSYASNLTLTKKSSKGNNDKNENKEVIYNELTASINTAASAADSSSITGPAVAAITEKSDAPQAAYVSSAAAKRSSLADLDPEPETASSAKKGDNKVSFSVYAGSHISYAEGSSNKVNLGAGFSSDIALSKKLRLSAGLALTQNDLSFKRNIPPGAEQSFTAAFGQQAASGTYESPSSLKVMNYKLEGYDASFLGLDVPLNLTYTFSEKNNEMFVSAGISSGTFINESYSYYYSGRSLSGDRLSEASPVANVNESESLRSFEFARMLNFSFGLGYPLGKQNILFIEPFLKYPLRGIGEENLRFGAGGVNLKINFKAASK